MKFRFQVVAMGSFVVLAMAQTALAAPIQWRVEDGGNGHFYNVIGSSRGISWTDANAATIARGSGWHLATIASAEENAFVYGLVAGKPTLWSLISGSAQGPWLGGQRKGDGSYSWVTGEPFTYTNWAPGRPSGIGDRIGLYGPDAPDGPTWSNVSSKRADVHSYVMETEQAEQLFGVIEEPTCLGSAGISNIRGFAYSSINGVTIDRIVDVIFDRGTLDEAETEVPCCSSRGDVHEAFPVAPVRSGFSGIFNWCLLTPGKHTISLVFQSSTNNTLTVTRDFLTFCEHPEKSFLLQNEFDWAGGAESCGATSGGSLLCRPKADVCDGQVSYQWNQASQSLVLHSGCIPSGSSAPALPACSDTITEETGTADN